MSPDQVKISYVLLNAKDLQSEIKVSEQDARDAIMTSIKINTVPPSVARWLTS